MLLANSCSIHQDSDAYTHVVETPVFNIYYPDFDNIELRFGEPPSRKDTSVLFCCMAAFTEKRRLKFTHVNIAGPYIDHGSVYPGYECPYNTGIFTYFDKQWAFLPLSDADVLTESAKKGGMGFSQIMIIPYFPRKTNLDKIIWESRHFKLYKNERGIIQFRDKRHRYRALCEKDQRLCVVELKKRDTYASFVQKLAAYGFDKAIYLDTGFGWGYAWYRDAHGRTFNLRRYRHPYANNWIVFRKD